MEIRRILAKAGRWLTALLVGAVIFNGCDSKRDKAPEQPYKDLVSAEIVDLDGDGDSDIIIYKIVLVYFPRSPLANLHQYSFLLFYR